MVYMYVLNPALSRFEPMKWELKYNVVTNYHYVIIVMPEKKYM